MLGLTTGEIVQGSFLYDEGVPDTDPDGDVGFYQNSVFNMRFDGFFAPRPQIDYSYLSKRAFTDQVAAYVNVVEADISDVYSFNIYSVTGPDVNLDDQFDLRKLQLEDYPECTSTSACVFFQRAWLESEGSTPVTFVAGNLLSLRITPIHEPSGAALVLLALAGLAVSRHRASQSRSP